MFKGLAGNSRPPCVLTALGTPCLRLSTVAPVSLVNQKVMQIYLENIPA